MSVLFPAGFTPEPSEDEWTRTVDPRVDRDVRHEWLRQTARWRTMAIAQAVFGGDCTTRFGSFPSTGVFEGLLEIEVPFAGPDDHFRREDVFRACVASDPVLGPLPLLFVFRPRPTRRVTPRPLRESA